MHVKYLLIVLLFFPNYALNEEYEVIADGKPTIYTTLKTVNQPWKICALLPHAKDRYWWGVSWILEQKAESLGLEIGIYDAGGYGNKSIQRQQFRDCVKLGAHAIILAATNASYFNEEIEIAQSANIPVIDLINGIYNSQVTERASVSFKDMAKVSIEELQKLNLLKSGDKIYFLPGPRGAKWVEDVEQELYEQAKLINFEVINAGYGNTDVHSQVNLVRQLFDKHKPKVIIANAVAATLAAKLIKQMKSDAKVFSFYTNSDVLKLLNSGALIGAASDFPLVQAHVSLDLAIRSLENSTLFHRVGAKIKVLDKDEKGELITVPDNIWFTTKHFEQ